MPMNITEPFVLKNDVVLIPCAELSDDVRGRISFDEGDYTLSRRHGRIFSQVIDSEVAALLTLFREPRTISDAIIANGRALGKDLNAWFDELLPHIGTFLDNRVLVPVGDEEESEMRPRLDSGGTFRGWDVVRCVSLMEDSEVYQLRRGGETAALKIARAPVAYDGSLLGNEIEILRHLDGGGIAPRLLDAGVDEERPFLVIEWVAGAESSVAASMRRHDRAALIEICASIAAAYAALHARGVLHSDVHPRNVLVDESGKVTLLDFGFSRFADHAPRIGRGGLYYFFEPEYLAAQRQGFTLPSSAAGEQYALAAMLYLLVSGHHYLDFRYDRDEMMRQAESDPPLPLATHGMPPWPDLEAILARALEKDPARRHASIAEMAALLAGAREAAQRESTAAPLTAESEALLAATLQSFARGGAAFAEPYPEAPRASINFGCAGAAVAMLRMAETRGDPKLLALADVWSSRALAMLGDELAFVNADFDMPRELIGEVTPYHTESGVHAAAALVAAATGNVLLQRRSVAAFVAASTRPCEQLDLVLGRSGTLLGATLLLESSSELPEAATLRALGATTMNEIWRELDERPLTFLGMAHGWAGYLYATLRWCMASGDAVPPRVTERLDELAALRMPRGRGVCWPMSVGGNGPSETMPGWCHGSAGMLFLWTLAQRLDLAELCAWDAWDAPRTIANLCCGSAGRAYALLNLYKQTGETAWLSRARQLANDAALNAAETAQRTNSLWKGELGVAVLIADLASPETARMPFFE